MPELHGLLGVGFKDAEAPRFAKGDQFAIGKDQRAAAVELGWLFSVPQL